MPTDRLSRTIALVQACRREQSDPDAFYLLLAADSAQLVSRWAALPDATVLDIGRGPGYFADAFKAVGARYASCEVNLAELLARGARHPGAVIGDGQAIRSATPRSTSAFLRTCSNMSPTRNAYSTRWCG